MRHPTRWNLTLAWILLLSGNASAQDLVLAPERVNHWAWKIPGRPAPPAVTAKGWLQNPIDAFILAKLEAAGIEPAAPASRAQLIRRVTFDLIGLPPTPEEIDAFIHDNSPRAWEKVIDRLLASSHYGERWGRHWLDLARYADTNGYEHDEVRPDMWRYRDYVIRSLNSDVPYDRFIKDQLAGDELYPASADALIATGFNLLGPDMTDAANQAKRRQNTLDDMTETAGLVFLGMTIGCARCHDHKFEAIPQTDFYRLEAFFASAQFRRDLPIAGPAERAAYEKNSRAYQKLIDPTVKALRALEEPYRRKLHDERLAKVSEESRRAYLTPAAQRTPRQRDQATTTARLIAVSPKQLEAIIPAPVKARQRDLHAVLKRLERHKPALPPVAMGLHDGPAARTFLLQRGELGNPGAEMQPGIPVVFTPGQRPLPLPGAANQNRARLADWIAAPDNPLTARVMVNRLWQHHFGRGIVATASDFGVRGERPSHPGLLDWLAREFVTQGWSIKRMHKLMLLSATYQQSTAAKVQRPEAAAAVSTDTANELLSHMNRRRLEGEIIRDSLLALSGRLNSRSGGPGVLPPLPAPVQGWKPSANPSEHVRRSIYIFARRNMRFPFLDAFDLPDSNLTCPKRERSTTAPQALVLLNSGDVVKAANDLAERVGRTAKSTDERITLIYRLALGRRPALSELEWSREFLRASPLGELCRAVFNLNEFVYLD